MDDNKEQKAEQASVVETVTRPKHPGRVAQGKKLAALMKERKDALLKNRDSEVDKKPSSHTWQTRLNYLSYLLLICSVGGLYFYAFGAPFGYTQKTPVVVKPPEPVSVPIKKWME